MELPIKASEAAAVAELILGAAEGKTLNDELRNAAVSQSAPLQLSTIQPYFGSLAADPIHPSTYYLRSTEGTASLSIAYRGGFGADGAGVFPSALG